MTTEILSTIAPRSSKSKYPAAGIAGTVGSDYTSVRVSVPRSIKPLSVYFGTRRAFLAAYPELRLHSKFDRKNRTWEFWSTRRPVS